MEEAIKFMEENSYLELEDEQEEMLVYSTRENGDCLNEEPGHEDISHVRVIQKGIHKLGYNTEIEPVDEYIMLTIFK